MVASGAFPFGYPQGQMTGSDSQGRVMGGYDTAIEPKVNYRWSILEVYGWASRSHDEVVNSGDSEEE